MSWLVWLATVATILYVASVVVVFLLLWADGVPGWREAVRNAGVAVAWPVFILFGRES